MNYNPYIREYVSKIDQNLHSTDAALLRIMQATLYLRAVHSVHVTRRLFSSRVHCKRIKLDGFEAANSRPITLHGTLVLFSVHTFQHTCLLTCSATALPFIFGNR